VQVLFRFLEVMVGCECGWRVSICRGRRAAGRREAKVVLPLLGIDAADARSSLRFFYNRLPLGGNDNECNE